MEAIIPKKSNLLRRNFKIERPAFLKNFAQLHSDYDGCNNVGYDLMIFENTEQEKRTHTLTFKR
jgi:hypothetical protein